MSQKLTEQKMLEILAAEGIFPDKDGYLHRKDFEKAWKKYGII